MIAENVSPTRRLSLPNQSLFFSSRFCDRNREENISVQQLESTGIIRYCTRASNIGACKIQRRRPKSDRGVQNWTLVSNYFYLCSNLDTSVRFWTKVFNFRYQCSISDTRVRFWTLVSDFIHSIAQFWKQLFNFKHQCLILDSGV